MIFGPASVQRLTLKRLTLCAIKAGELDIYSGCSSAFITLLYKLPRHNIRVKAAAARQTVNIGTALNGTYKYLRHLISDYQDTREHVRSY